MQLPKPSVTVSQCLVRYKLYGQMKQQVRVFNHSVRQSQWNHVRSVSRVNVKIAKDSSQEWLNAKPFSEIPGPKKLDYIRGFLPGGIYHNKTMLDVILLTRQMYGGIIKIPSVFGRKSMLVSFNPDDFPTVIRSEGMWPWRRGLETVSYHRRVHKRDAFGGVMGLLGSNGEDWARIRSAVNPVLMQPRNARLYISKLVEVNDEFLQRIRDIRDPKTLEMPGNFEDEINRLTFESIAVIALNQQTGLIRRDRHNAEANALFDSLRSILDLTVELDVQPSLWKILKTPTFYKMMKNHDTMYDIIMKYINQALERIENMTSSTNDNEEKSVLEKLLKIDKKIAVVMGLDMLMAGVDTTSSTLIGILLCIAKSPDKQEKLRQEIRHILPRKNSRLTVNNIQNLPYLRACIKEGMRIYPIGWGGVRSNAEDIVMSGYQVPKYQEIVLNSHQLFMEQKYCPQAKEFIPERWLCNKKGEHLPMDHFTYTPFGFGARSCVGKRLVETELEITVARLVRNFYMEFNYPTGSAFKTHLINLPNIPLRFKLSEVED